MQLLISHITQYDFETPPSYGLQQVRLSPKLSKGQDLKDWSLTFEGASVQTVFSDYHNNKVHLIRIDTDAMRITVKSEGHVEVTDTHGIIETHGGFLPLWYFLRQTNLTQPGPMIRNIADELKRSEGTDLERLHKLSAHIGQRVTYQVGETNVMSTAEQAVSVAAGVCQDHTHIFTSAARLAGFPARYVSGYLMMDDRIDQEATHAWAEIHIDDLGWIGFDVSNQISPDSRYVRVATGLDYSGAAPISGLTQGGSGESIDVQLRVQQQ